MNTSENFRQIGLASFIMMASVVASRIIGLGRESVIAWAGGVESAVDAYQIAFIIPEILNHITASGFLSITFIPIFTRYLAKGKEEEGWKILCIILNGFGSMLLGFIIVSILFAPELVSLLAPGISKNTDTFYSAVRMTRIIIPAQFFFFSGGLFMAVQFSRKKFFVPALAPLIYNCGIIIGGVFLFSRIGMEGFAWGVLGGAFLGNFLVQWASVKKAGFKYYLSFDLTHPDFRVYILLTLPLMLGLTMTFSTEILLKFFGSFLDEGRIAAMNYALRIMFILVGFFGQAAGTASYPFMAEIAARKNMASLNQVINQALKFIFLAIPFSVLFMILRDEIVFILFQRGRFDTHAKDLTVTVLPYFLAGTFAFSAQTIVSRGYFAIQNTIFPVICSTLCVSASLPVLYGLIKICGMKGLAGGLSFCAAMGSYILFECWNRKSHNKGKWNVYIFFGKMLILGLFIGIVLYFEKQFLRIWLASDQIVSAVIICLIIVETFLIFMRIAVISLNIQKDIPFFFDKFIDRILFLSRHQKN